MPLSNGKDVTTFTRCIVNYSLTHVQLLLIFLPFVSCNHINHFSHIDKRHELMLIVSPS